MEKIRYIQSSSFVLSAREYAEADLAVDLLLPRFGPLRVIAKNARRSQKRFMGCLTVPSSTFVSLAKRADTWYLEEARLLNSYIDLKKDPELFALTCYILEMIVKTVTGADPESQSTRLLAAALRLVRDPPRDTLLKKLLFDLKVLTLHGLIPVFTSCLLCPEGKAMRVLAGFDVRQGGALCKDHMDPGRPGTLKPSRGVLELLERFSRLELRVPRGLVLSPRQRREALDLSGRLVEEHLGARPGSLAVLGQILRRNRRRRVQGRPSTPVKRS